MNKKIFYIIILVSLFVQAEYYGELMIYDELSHLSFSTATFSYFVYVTYTILHFWLIFFLDIRIVNRIEESFPWDKFFIKRILVEFVFTSANAIIITTPLTIFINHGLIMPLFEIPSDGLKYTLYYNLLYILVYNAIFVITYEGVYFYGERKSLQLEWEKAQKQNILSQFDALKNQINPHFLFNSMNALSVLIKSDTAKAVKFTREFSKVFRYTLDIKDNVVIKLSEELDFVNAYIYLQNIRYGNNLDVQIEIDAKKLNDYMPPFSLQLPIENALKHNVISTELPLRIYVRNKGDFIEVLNNMQPRKEVVASTKIGQINLEKRYGLISDEKPTFHTDGITYTARIPILSENQVN